MTRRKRTLEVLQQQAQQQDTDRFELPFDELDEAFGLTDEKDND